MYAGTFTASMKNTNFKSTYMHNKQRHLQQNTSASWLMPPKPWVLLHISVPAYAVIYGQNEHPSHTPIQDMTYFLLSAAGKLCNIVSGKKT